MTLDAAIRPIADTPRQLCDLANRLEMLKLDPACGAAADDLSFAASELRTAAEHWGQDDSAHDVTRKAAQPGARG